MTIEDKKDIYNGALANLNQAYQLLSEYELKGSWYLREIENLVRSIKRELDIITEQENRNVWRTQTCEQRLDY